MDGQAIGMPSSGRSTPKNVEANDNAHIDNILAQATSAPAIQLIEPTPPKKRSRQRSNSSPTQSTNPGDTFKLGAGLKEGRKQYYNRQGQEIVHEEALIDLPLTPVSSRLSISSEASSTVAAAAAVPNSAQQPNQANQMAMELPGLNTAAPSGKEASSKGEAGKSGGGGEAIGYNQMDGEGWKALDELLSLRMKRHHFLPDHINRFNSLLQLHTPSLHPLPHFLFVHLFLRSLQKHHPQLYQTGQYYLTSIKPDATWDELVDHLVSVDRAIGMVRGIDKEKMKEERVLQAQAQVGAGIGAPGFKGRKGSHSQAGSSPAQFNPWSTSPPYHKPLLLQSSSPESDTRTDLGGGVPAAAAGTGTGAAGMDIDIDVEMMTKYGSEQGFQLAPLSKSPDEDFSAVEMDAVNIMMQLGRR